MKTFKNKGPFILLSVLACVLSSAVWGVVTDDFEVAHDYATTASASFWDGYLINEGFSTTQDQDAVLGAVDTTTNPGVLTLTSTSSDIQGPWDDGLILYTTVPADVDVDMSVQMVGGSFQTVGGSATAYCAAGLIMRGADQEAKENLDNVVLYAFDRAEWNAVYLWSSNDDSAESEEAIGPSSSPAIADLGTYPWIRITRVGSVFTAYASQDGTNWIQVGSQVDRPDLTGKLEVGLSHSAYTATESSGQFDNFYLDYGPAATAPMPKSGQGTLQEPSNPLFQPVPIDLQELSWAAPEDPNFWEGSAVTYDVYFGEDPNLVLVSEGQSETSYALTETLTDDTVYAWRIDSWVVMEDANDINDAMKVSSPIWTFQTPIPNLKPLADAGEDIYTWPDETDEDPDYIVVTLDGSYTDDGNPIGGEVTVEWIEVLGEGEEAVVEFIDLATMLTPKVKVPSDLMRDYTMRLTVNDGEKEDDDTMLIRVRNNSCEAALVQGTGYIRGDYNDDCKLNLADFAEFAADWLLDTNLIKP